MLFKKKKKEIKCPKINLKIWMTFTEKIIEILKKPQINAEIQHNQRFKDSML